MSSLVEKCLGPLPQNFPAFQGLDIWIIDKF